MYRFVSFHFFSSLAFGFSLFFLPDTIAAAPASVVQPAPLTLLTGPVLQVDAGAMAVGDLNGDMIADLVIGQANRLAVSLVDAAALPSPPAFYAAGERPRAVTLADFDQDGRLDAAVADETANYLIAAGTVTVLRGDGSGGLTRFGTHPVGRRPLALATGDFDGNGVVDLAAANWGSGTVSVLLSKPGGGFAPAVSYNVGTNPTDLCAADFNRDGRIDLVTADSGDAAFTVLSGNGDGTFTGLPADGAGSWPMSVACGDFDGNRIADLVFANDGTDSLTFRPGRGDGTFGAGATVLAGKYPRRVLAVDLNRDGMLDLIVVRQCNGGIGENALEVLLGRGGGTFTPPTPVHAAPPTGIHDLYPATGDFNRDGKTDLAVADGYQDFLVQQRLRMWLAPLLPGDLDADDRIDLADAVIALQAGTGKNCPATSRVGVDIDGDGRIGPAEAGFILRRAGGL